MAAESASQATTAPPTGDLTTQQAYLLLARNLRRLGQPVCALWPASHDTKLKGVPEQLATALASLGLTVGILARPAIWWDDTSRKELSITALRDGVDTLVPARTRTTDFVAIVEQTIESVRGRYACVLVDLSGLDATAAQDVALVPGIGIVLFVTRGRLGEHALAKLRRRFPAERLLGAVLVDERPNKRLPLV